MASISSEPATGLGPSSESHHWLLIRPKGRYCCASFTGKEADSTQSTSWGVELALQSSHALHCHTNQNQAAAYPQGSWWQIWAPRDFRAHSLGNESRADLCLHSPLLKGSA